MSLIGNTVLLLLVVQTIKVTVISSITFRPVIIPEDRSGTCLSQDKHEAEIQRISAVVSTMLTNQMKFKQNPGCGDGLWYQVGYLNMSDPSHRCPSPWTVENSCGIRTCRRPESPYATCSATFYTTGDQYSRVCGRAIGYQIGSTDAFGYNAKEKPLDSYYVSGVSITHGAPRRHVWTFAAGVSEGGYIHQDTNCPCSDPSHSGNVLPPSFVGDNYYCESANPTSMFVQSKFYCDDPLWDGQQCEGHCCSNGKSPPWFSVELPNPTADDIEVRLCCSEGYHDDIAVHLLEIYVQ